MTGPAITAKGLGKRYRLSAAAAPYRTLGETLSPAGLLRRTLARLRGDHAAPAAAREFWALRDVDLEVSPGERLGVIGRNGAGKSTLLKVISRITEPTEGQLAIRGRVASLLEVGTGFHPELSGRENIFLNGSIMGMRRAEIARQFDAIVDFAGVAAFLDTPVKRYSSGMYVRLAFAVAAHLECETLIIDEVLAVGDAQFQRKCLGKMGEVSRSGRTLIFVSHSMAAVQSLCTSALLLSGGRVAGRGGVPEQVAAYMDMVRAGGAGRESRSATLGDRLVLDRLTVSPNPVGPDDPVRFTLDLSATGPVALEGCALVVQTLGRVRVGIVDLRAEEPHAVAPGAPLRITGEIDRLPLVEGDYQVGFYVRYGSHDVFLEDLVVLTVVSPDSLSALPPYDPGVRGVLEFGARFTVGSPAAEPAEARDGVPA